MAVIVHSFVPQNPKWLKKNKDADCTKCRFAKKTALIDGGEGYVCKVALFDTKTLACFAPKGYDPDIDE